MTRSSVRISDDEERVSCRTVDSGCRISCESSEGGRLAGTMRGGRAKEWQWMMRGGCAKEGQGMLRGAKEWQDIMRGGCAKEWQGMMRGGAQKSAGHLNRPCRNVYIDMYVGLYLVGEDAAPMYGYGEAALIFTVMERCSDSYGYGEVTPIFTAMERLLRFSRLWRSFSDDVAYVDLSPKSAERPAGRTVPKVC